MGLFWLVEEEAKVKVAPEGMEPVVMVVAAFPVSRIKVVTVVGLVVAVVVDITEEEVEVLQADM